MTDLVYVCVQVWPQAFQAEMGDLPLEMQAPCCSSFMVSRERVLAHSADFYIHLRDWILRCSSLTPRP